MMHSAIFSPDPCCAPSFSGEPSPGSSIRYVETQSMQIGASYSLQFSLVMGCGREPSPHIDTQVRLEFSTNHGLTWHLVKEVRRNLFTVINMQIYYTGVDMVSANWVENKIIKQKVGMKQLIFTFKKSLKWQEKGAHKYTQTYSLVLG